MTTISKPSIIYIQTFFEHVPYILGSNSDKKRLVSAEEISE